MRTPRLALTLLPLALYVAGCGDVEGGSTDDPDAMVDASLDVFADATGDAAMLLDGRGATDVPRADTDAGVSPDAPRPDVFVGSDAGADVVMPQPDVPMPVLASAVLEVQALDLWAQPLPAEGRTLTVRRGGVDVTTSAGSAQWVRTLDLTDRATYEISLGSPDFRPLAVTVSFDGTPSAAGLTARTSATGHGLSLSHTMRTVGGRSVMVHTLFLGLRHQWFSAQGRPARRGNDLRLLMDGEEAWTSVAAEIRAARATAHLTTWWWESDFELLRDARLHPTQTEAQRRPNTVLAMLEASAARKRVMVGQFLSMDGTLSNTTTDAPLRAHATTAGDNFEHMGQANPSRGMFRWEIPPFRFGDRVRAEVAGTTAVTFDAEASIASEVAPRMIDVTEYPTMLDVNLSSYHQKFAVFDQRVAFIGGMNLRRVDWDTSQHLVFEPRRELFGATAAARARVISHDALPDNGPRKDYMVRIQGPIVRDAEDVFHRRWRYLLDTHARYAEDASDFTVAPPPAPVAGGVMAQVTATLPAPFNEYAIAETWLNAVAQARDYIYIEDQYFRIPMLTDVIQRRMDEVPGLRLVVITKPINEWTDPGCAWTYRTHQQFSTRYPGRYLLLQLRAFDTQVTFGFDETDARFVDMDTHAKILIVDDTFLSVGSCNKNNRGIVYEGEMNVAVLDRAWVRAARRRIFTNLLGAAPVSDDTGAWWSQLTNAALANDRVRANWTDEGDDISLDGRPLPAMYTPHGFVYTLTFGPPADCLLESIGPDVV